MVKSKLLAAVAGIALMTLSACGGGGGNSSEDTMLRRSVGANPDTMDPHKAEGTWENDIIGDMLVGLFTEDVKGQPVKGMAASYEVSEDQLTWTFTLRDANWSDGQPVTAYDFEYGMRRMLDPSTIGAVYASLLYPLKNALAVNAGDMPIEALGVRAIDDKTLEVQLENPAPYLPGLFKHYVSFPVPKHVVEAHGDQWTRPENIVVNGAYKLAEWRQGDFVRSVKNPQFFDAENVCFEQVVYFPYSDHDAVVRMAQTDKLDIANAFPNERLEELKKVLPGWPRLYPMMSTTYVALNFEAPSMQDQRVRNALAMALDREYLTDEVMASGQTPSYGLVPDGMANYPNGAKFDWMGTSREELLTQAKALLQEAGYGPDNPLEFEYNFRSTGENPKVAPVLQANWREIADWVQPKIQRIETRVLYNKLQQSDFETSDAGWVADFNDPFNFLYLLDSRTGAMNYGNYQNAEFDALIDKSNVELDPAKRSALLLEAEELILDDVAVIPVFSPGRQYLVNPEITGFEGNVEDIHRSRYMCREGLQAANE